jgi:hypothetical protein
MYLAHRGDRLRRTTQTHLSALATFSPSPSSTFCVSLFFAFSLPLREFLSVQVTLCLVPFILLSAFLQPSNPPRKSHRRTFPSHCERWVA